MAVLALTGWEASALPLEEEISYLLRNHPQLKGLRSQVSASEEGINRAFSGYLPKIEVNGDYGYESTDSPARRAANPDAESLGTARTRGTLTITENLFDGWRTSADYNAAILNKRGSEIRLGNTTQNVIFEGISAYIDVLRNRRLVDLASQNEEVIKTQLNLENERVLRGSGIALDVLQSKARLQIARERRVAFEGDLANAVTRYIQVFGHAPEADAMVVPDVPSTLLPLTVEEAVATAMVEHPESLNSQNLIEIAQQRRRTARSDYFPRIDLVGKLNYEDNVDGVESVRRDHSVIVRANWALFSGFSTRASVAEAAYQYAATMDNRTFVDQKVVEDVHLSWENLQTAQRRLELLGNAVNIAIEVHQARVILRDTGKETVLNVLDAQNEVFDAQINEASADFDMRVAGYRVLLAMGRLDAEGLVLALSGAGDPAEVAAAAVDAVAVTAAPDEPVVEPTVESAAEPAVVTAEPVATVTVTSTAPTTVTTGTVVEPTVAMAPAEPAQLSAEPASAELANAEPAAEPASVEAASGTSGSFDFSSFATEPQPVEPQLVEPQPAATTATYVPTPDSFESNLSRSWFFD
ncbi:MAG: TolC family outer membrane protein [Alphaproteobacteria bacterium]